MIISSTKVLSKRMKIFQTLHNKNSTLKNIQIRVIDKLIRFPFEQAMSNKLK